MLKLITIAAAANTVTWVRLIEMFLNIRFYLSNNLAGKYTILNKQEGAKLRRYTQACTGLTNFLHQYLRLSKYS
jgi:hypothetical protein